MKQIQIVVYENLSTYFQQNRDKRINEDLMKKKKTLLENSVQTFLRFYTFYRYTQTLHNTSYTDQLKSLSSTISFNWARKF